MPLQIPASYFKSSPCFNAPFFFKFQCLANSDHPKLNISREGDTVNLVGQAVNKNLKNDACSTFFTSSLPEIRQGLLYIWKEHLADFLFF